MTKPSTPPREEWSEAAPTLLKHDSATVKKVRQLVEVPVPRLTLCVRTNGEERTIEHVGEVCRVGSHHANDVVLHDRTVSRFHCRLVHDGSRWRVTDCGSSNGTKLDGVTVRDAEFDAQATLSLGDTTVTVRVLEDGEVLLPNPPSFGSILGSSVTMKKLFALLEKVAASESNLLVNGESGTGKELVASEIVQRGRRQDKPFVVVDCGALSPTLVES
jgi:pSer/pThr/pTyr-binding forkhead associated (FHA) protein